VSSDAQAVQELIFKYQSRSTPTLVIDGQVVIGFDPEELDRLIA
jgi:glutaredoxin